MNRVLDCVSMLSRTRQGGEIRLGEDSDAPALVTEKLHGGGGRGRLPGPVLSPSPLRSRFFSGMWAPLASFDECVRDSLRLELQDPYSSSQHGSSCEFAPGSHVRPRQSLLLSDRVTADLERKTKTEQHLCMARNPARGRAV